MCIGDSIGGVGRANGLHRPAFLPASRRPLDEMRAELGDVINTLAPPWRDLVARLLLDGPLAERFAIAPAARGMHHAYVGGLLEHTLSMAAVARLLAGHYPCLLYTSPSPRDRTRYRMPSSA